MMYRDASTIEQEIQELQNLLSFAKAAKFQVGNEVCFIKQINKKLTISRVMVSWKGTGIFYNVHELDEDYPVFEDSIRLWTPLQDKLYDK